MRWVYFCEKLIILLLIPAFIGSIFMKTLIGAITVGVSCTLIVIAATIGAIIKKDPQMRFIIAGDIAAIAFDCMLLANYYFKRKDIAMYIIVAMILFVCVFCFIDMLKRRNRRY